MVREKLVKCKVERSEDIFGRKVGFELMELIGDWIDTERFMEERSRWKTNGPVRSLERRSKIDIGEKE